MPLSVDFGQIALIIVQLIMLFITFYVQSRQMSALDIEKRDRGIFGTNVSEALRVANLALRGVELMETSKYNALADKHTILLQECTDMRVQILGLEESIKSLSAKLSSRQRADTIESRRASQVPEEEINPPVARPPKGQVDLEWLKEQGLAVPLGNAAQQPQPPNSVPFGKMIKG